MFELASINLPKIPLKSTQTHSSRLVSCLSLIVGHQNTQKEAASAHHHHHHHPEFTRYIHQFTHLPLVSTTDNYSLIQSGCLQHCFKNWQHLRRNRLTASTFASAIGFWRGRRIQLWLEKLGALDPFIGNPATWWNNISEEQALEKYKLITGNKVSSLEFQLDKNSQDDWLGCSPDGLVVGNVVYQLSSCGVLEIKCPFFGGDKTRSYPWSRLPLYCIPQAQGLLEILDKDWMDCYCWTLNGSSLFRIRRDREYWELLRKALSDFWWNNVQPAKEWYSKSPITNPLIELRPFRPAPRHELCPDIVNASKYLVHDSKLLMREIHGKLQTQTEEVSWDFS